MGEGREVVLQVEGTACAKTQSQQSKYTAHTKYYEAIQSGGAIGGGRKMRLESPYHRGHCKIIKTKHPPQYNCYH